jgi:hypothetical protein
MQRLTPNVEEQLLRLSACVSLGTGRGPELLRVASDALATDIASPAAVELASKYSASPSLRQSPYSVASLTSPTAPS